MSVDWLEIIVTDQMLLNRFKALSYTIMEQRMPSSSHQRPSLPQ